MVAHHARYILVSLALLLLASSLAPAAAAAAPNPPPAPCYQAAIAALTKRGAIYSQGGALPQDPLDPATGQPYPRTGPDSFDCSGLVWWAYGQAGISIGLTTYQQLNNGARISCGLADLAGEQTRCWTLGDLIFLRYDGGQHVAIYVGDGLFMDCYNHATGCILHDVAGDAFYRRHFFQARRIVSGCEELTHDPGQPVPVAELPQLEAIPPLLTPLQLVIPWQCGACGAGVTDLAPLPVPEVNWFDLGAWFPWLASQLWNLVALPLICWALAIAQAAANLLQLAVNRVAVAGVNGFWRLLVLTVLWGNDLVASGWLGLADVRLLLWASWGQLLQLAAQIAALLQLLPALLTLAGALVDQRATLVLGLAQALAYLTALLITLVPALVAAVTQPTLPPQLQQLADFFLIGMLRETLQAIADSRLGWAWSACIALFYARFALWLIDEASQLNS